MNIYQLAQKLWDIALAPGKHATPEFRAELEKALAEHVGALKFIQFQAESWSNTGDTRSLRDAMKHFDVICTRVLQQVPESNPPSAAENVISASDGKSITPRTDAATEFYLNERNQQIKYVSIEFARQLEREP